jgi:hypothetical protein
LPRRAGVSASGIRMARCISASFIDHIQKLLDGFLPENA